MRNYSPNWTNTAHLLRRSSVVFVAILTCVMVHPAYANDCIKQVFNRYCLGADIKESLAGIIPDPKTLLLDNNKTLNRFEDSGKVIEITADNNITVKVVRQETPGGWINYTAWKVKLIRLYGRGRDLSSFPAYASSRSSRLNAINAGRGSAKNKWDQEGYSIILIWDNPQFLELQYVLKQDKINTTQNSEGL